MLLLVYPLLLGMLLRYMGYSSKRWEFWAIVGTTAITVIAV